VKTGPKKLKLENKRNSIERGDRRSGRGTNSRFNVTSQAIPNEKSVRFEGRESETGIPEFLRAEKGAPFSCDNPKKKGEAVGWGPALESGASEWEFKHGLIAAETRWKYLDSKRDRTTLFANHPF